MRQGLFFLFLIALLLCRWHSPATLKPQQLTIRGTIASIPELKNRAWHFLWSTDQPKMRLWVSWYAPPSVSLRVGDNWLLTVKIKPSDNNWLFSQKIQGTGIVQMDFHNQRMAQFPWRYPIDHLRQILNDHLRQALDQNEGLGFISALTIGIRDHITTSQWDDLRGTGTNHLMAIAGLHIGFLSSFIYGIVNFLWRRFTRLMLLIPAQEAATVSALLAAFFYSILAGFALPTQRAIFMLSIFLFTKLWRRQILLFHSWATALLFVLIINPFAILTASFWLSFTAVALLIYGNGGRLYQTGILWHCTRAQWVIALGLMPLSLLFFQQVSLIGIIANNIAIPFIGFIILPLSLAGIVILPISTQITTLFWQSAAYLLMHFWPLIHYLAHLPHTQWYTTVPNKALLISTSMSVILWLAPRGWPHRWLGWLWLLPLLLRH